MAREVYGDRPTRGFPYACRVGDERVDPFDEKVVSKGFERQNGHRTLVKSRGRVDHKLGLLGLLF